MPAPLRTAVILLVGMLALPARTGLAAPSTGDDGLIFDKARQTAMSIVDAGERGRALLRIAEGCAQVGFTVQARAMLADAEAAAPESADPSGLLRRIGRAYLDMGARTDAMRAAQGIVDPQQKAQLLLAIADVCIDASALADAENALTAVNELLASMEDVGARAGTLGQLAARYARFQPDKAAELLHAAAEQARQAQEPARVGELLAALVQTCSAMGDMSAAEQIAGDITDPVQRLRAYLSLAALHEQTASTAEANRLRALADQLSGGIPPRQRFKTLSAMAADFTTQNLPSAAVDALARAERVLADWQVSSDERTAAIQQLAVRYGDLGHWDEAARLAESCNDFHSRTKFRASAVVQLVADGRLDEAMKLFDDLDTEHLKYIGRHKLRILAQIYHDARPAAGIEELARLEPMELRDAVLGVFAMAAARAGDCDRTMDLVRRVSNDVSRAVLYTDAARAGLESAAPDQLPGAVQAASQALEALSTDYDRLQVLFALGHRHLTEGNLPEARAALEELTGLQDFAELPEIQSEAQCRAAILQDGLGLHDEARRYLREAVGTAEAIGCGSCRNDTLESMFREMFRAGSFELFQAGIDELQLPSMKVDTCLHVLGTASDLRPEHVDYLLRSALRAATRQVFVTARLQSLVRVATAYAQQGRRPGEPELQILESATPVELAPLAQDPMGARIMQQSGAGSAPDTVHLAFFTRPGCASCRDAKVLLERVIAQLPELHVQVEEYDLDGSRQAAALNKILCQATGVAERDFLLAPSIFSVDAARIGGDITEDTLRSFIQSSRGLPSPDEVFGPAVSRVSVLSEYESLKPLVVVSAGLIDGINPCAFAVIIFFVSYLTYIGKSKREVFATGVVFTLAVFVTYFAIGLGLERAISLGEAWSTRFATILHLVVAAMALVAAVLSFRDGVLCLKGRQREMTLSLPDSLKSKIRLTIAKRARLGLTVAATAILGMLVAFFEFPCTGQIYVPIVTMLQEPDYFWGPVAWLFLYNMCFIAPLVVILIALLFGLTSEKLTALFRQHMAKAKFAMGALFAVMFGVMLLYIL